MQMCVAVMMIQVVMKCRYCTMISPMSCLQWVPSLSHRFSCCNATLYRLGKVHLRWKWDGSTSLQRIGMLAYIKSHVMHRTIDSSYGSNVTIVQSDVFIVHVVFLLDILIQLLVCSSRRLQDTTTLVRGWRCVPAGSPQGVVCFKSPSPLKAAPVFVWGRTAICSRPHPCSCWSFLVLLWRMAVSTLSVGTTVCNITSFM